MKPPPFLHREARSLGQALDLLAEHGDEAKVLAGGQSLIPLLSLRFARPGVLVDLNPAAELGRIEGRDGEVAVGAMARERAAERSDVVRQRVPLLAAAMPHIGHDAIRTRGTVGGSLAHADPAAELPAVALALGATFVVAAKARGQRTITAADFFQGYFTTALAEDEVLVEIRFPDAPPRTGASFLEVSRRHGDFAMVGAGVSVTLTDGVIGDARIALTNVADVPVRAAGAEAALRGQAPSEALFAEAATAAVADLDPPADLHASSAYRRKVGGHLVGRALAAATRDAEGTT